MRLHFLRQFAPPRRAGECLHVEDAPRGAQLRLLQHVRQTTSRAVPPYQLQLGVRSSATPSLLPVTGPQQSAILPERPVTLPHTSPVQRPDALRATTLEFVGN